MTGAVIRTEGRRQSGEVLAKREKEVLASLANKPRVDLRWLSEDEKQRIREVLDELHNGRRLSLLRISQMVGKSYTKIWGLCRALEMPTRNVAEADRNSAELRSKHKRSPFDGTEEERAYMLGFKNGDLTALQVSGTAVMVTSTTTHPAFANLFRELFEKYGPVYQYPMQEKGKGYKWKLAVRLDNSFQFLLASGAIALSLVSRDRRAFMSWLAGLLDSDGSINLTHSNKHARILLVLHNTDLKLLQSAKQVLGSFGYGFVGPYQTMKKGMVTPRGIKYTKAMWNIALERTWEAKKLLGELPLKHGEKTRRKALALSLNRGARWEPLKEQVTSLSIEIRNEVRDFVKRAEAFYLAKHLSRANRSAGG